MENIFAYRLLTARKMAGISLQSLADKLGNVVTKQSLNKYEQGKMKPDSKLIILLSDILNVSVDYFFSEPSVSVDLSNIEFRKFKTKVSKQEEEAIIEKAKETFERYFELENILNILEQPDYFIYNDIIKYPEDAEKAAKQLREKWSLGNDPIPDVIKMLEDKGYKIIEIEAPDGFDGMKANTDGKKLIILKRSKVDEDVVRKRFTTLHELAHHVLKFNENIDDKFQEKLCHSFACAVLYPEEMAHKELDKERFHFYLNELQIIKEKWGISFSAIFSRALQLGIINDYVYKRLNMGYRQKGLHKGEPGSFMSKEKPMRFERLIYLALGKELISINEAAYFAGTSVWQFKELTKPLL